MGHKCSNLFQIPTEGQTFSDAQVEEARQGELAALAVRKYLDALCVYFWAATSLLTSILTFSLFVLLGHALTAEIVFTSLALFGVLIAPLNSFPWVINSCVEAVVSVRRLERCHLPSSLWPSLQEVFSISLYSVESTELRNLQLLQSSEL